MIETARDFLRIDAHAAYSFRRARLPFERCGKIRIRRALLNPTVL